MSKLSGIKSVDFKVMASGHGVVNWNGSTTLATDNGTTVDNHLLPKLRGFNPNTGVVKENGYKFRKKIQEIDLSETPMYISQNCLRHHLFVDQKYDMHYATKNNSHDILASITGLLRGYVIPSTQCKRTSPLLLDDFVEQLGKGNFEQFSKDAPLELKKIDKKELTEDKNENIVDDNGVKKTYQRSSNTLFSKTTYGETEYIGFGSISIEDLQFISLDYKFDSCAAFVKSGEGEKIAEKIVSFLMALTERTDLVPLASFHENYVRKGTIFKEGQAGILLNDDAIQILIDEMINRVATLYIRQSKGYMFVEDVIVDYNDSNKPMRIKKSEMNANPDSGKYAEYFEAI